MSWKTWLQATAIRLGISPQGSIPVEDALETLQDHEERLNTLRAQLISESADRTITVEEAVAFDVARGNLYAETKVLRAELVRLGVPSPQLPYVALLAGLPASVVSGVRFASTLSGGGSGALGAIPIGPDGFPRKAAGGADWAGTLGGTTAQMVTFGVLVIGILAASTAFVYVLIGLVNPEVALQQQVTESDVALAEAAAQIAAEWEATRRAAIENGVDPSTLTPPEMPDLSRLGTGNPLVSGLSVAKGVIGGLAVLAALFVGYKIWKASKEGD